MVVFGVSVDDFVAAVNADRVLCGACGSVFVFVARITETVRAPNSKRTVMAKKMFFEYEMIRPVGPESDHLGK